MAKAVHGEIPLSQPDITDLEEELVVKTLRSGRLALGPMTEKFEALVADRAGCRNGVAVSSGTCGLHLALRALNIGPGDEVITTPFSFIASANCILFVGAKPVFVDIDPISLNMDPALVAKAITPRTRAILPVHLFGHPCDIDPILEVAASAGLPVIEDASQATGASYKGRRVGGFGRVGCFSLYANKIVTSAEGGMIVTSDEELALRMRAIRNFGQMPGQHVRHAFLGGNYKMTDLCAAIGCAQIEKIDRYVAARRRQVDALNAALTGLDGLIERRPMERAWARAAPFGYHMLFRTALLRERALAALHAAGIETRPFFSLITAEEPYRSMGYAPDDTPVAADLVARGLYVSASPDLTAEDRQHVADTLYGVARAAGLG